MLCLCSFILGSPYHQKVKKCLHALLFIFSITCTALTKETTTKSTFLLHILYILLSPHLLFVIWNIYVPHLIQEAWYQITKNTGNKMTWMLRSTDRALKNLFHLRYFIPGRVCNYKLLLQMFTCFMTFNDTLIVPMHKE